jgi:outer membrane protein insertion porin family
MTGQCRTRLCLNYYAMNIFKLALFPAGSSTMRLTIAARQEVFLSLVKLIATVCLFVFAAHALTAQPRESSQTNYVIERLDLVGNRSTRTETILARISSRPGRPYSVEAARRDVRNLWNMQLFDDVRLEVEDSPDLPNGKIVVFIVRERPIISRIEYRGISSITDSDILEAWKNERVGLSVGSLFDRAKLKHAVVVISELLVAHGHQFATVKPSYETSPSSNTVTLVFNIDEGPKAQTSRNRS